MREFWLDETDEDGEKSYSVWTHREPTGIHTREVNPEYDAAVEGLVEALNFYKTDHPDSPADSALAAFEKAKAAMK